MRIAFVVGKFPKLSQTFILSQITGLIDCGHEVDVYANSNREQSPKLHADFEKYELKNRTFYFEDIPGNFIERAGKSLMCLLDLAYSSPKQALRLAQMSSNGLQDKLDTLVYSRMSALKGKPYDIVHCHFAQHNRRALLIQSVNSPNAKIVTTFHGYDVNVISPECNPVAYAEIFSKGTAFTANTQFTAKKAEMMGCPAQKIRILPVGLDISRYPYLPRQLQNDEPIKIVTVGRLVEKKGIDYAIKAVARAIQQMPELQFDYTIIGEGDQKRYLKQLAEGLNISEQVSFVGSMTQEQVREIYKSSHLFLLSSVTAANGDMEGQALVLQEAQCIGLPVISTLHNGIPDGVLDGQSGFLVPEKDVDALSEKLIYLASNPKTWASMGKVGHDFVKSRYDIQKLNGQLIGLYKNLLSGEDSENSHEMLSSSLPNMPPLYKDD